MTNKERILELRKAFVDGVMASAAASGFYQSPILACQVAETKYPLSTITRPRVVTLKTTGTQYKIENNALCYKATWDGDTWYQYYPGQYLELITDLIKNPNYPGQYLELITDLIKNPTETVEE